jgi:acyl-CoA synthetase (AMP-forming)/AMP-acid ligase II
MDIFHNIHGITIPALLRRQAEQHRFKLALSAPSHRGYRDRLSYAQLVHRMSAMAQGLHACGLRHGQRVGLLLSNKAAREAVLTALGCWQLGIAVAPLNGKASDEELRHAVELIDPAMLVVANALDVQRLASLGLGHIPTLRLDGPEGAPSTWPEPENRVAAPVQVDCHISPQDLSCLLFTSGTTARSKAVMHTHQSQLHAGLAIGGAMGLTANDTYQGAFPIFTSSAWNLACMSAWVYGAGVVLEEDGLDNGARLRLIHAECTSVYHGVPALLHFLVDEFARGGYDARCVRRLGYGGAPMPIEVMDKFAHHWPHVDQVHIWGMTETGPAGTALPNWMLPRLAGAVGIPQAGCSIRILSEASEEKLTAQDKQTVLRDASPGEVGEIAFAGLSAALGYFRNPDASAKTFVDGWVLTGDLGRIDREGVLHYVDRKKDVINRGGLKISSAAVEDAIYRCPGVAEVAVVAIPHPKLGEDVAACIVPKDSTSFDLEAVQAVCASLLAENAIPRQWTVFASLPKNAMGKVLKQELRMQLIASSVATAISSSSQPSKRDQP